MNKNKLSTMKIKHKNAPHTNNLQFNSIAVFRVFKDCPSTTWYHFKIVVVKACK